MLIFLSGVDRNRANNFICGNGGFFQEKERFNTQCVEYKRFVDRTRAKYLEKLNKKPKTKILLRSIIFYYCTIRITSDQ